MFYTIRNIDLKINLSFGEIMEPEIIFQARQTFIQGLSRISHFWGFPKAMGAIYGAIYLSPSPLGLDDLVNQIGVTKGAVSTNVRQLERLGMIHKRLIIGDRKDYYFAETDFWKIIKGILREREKSEFDIALMSVSKSLEMVNKLKSAEDQEIIHFYQQRLYNMQKIFKTLDKIVATALALEELGMNNIRRLFNERVKE
jgi:DNA-binding transcriptional regulator GbsR (MarR family)